MDCVNDPLVIGHKLSKPLRILFVGVLVTWMDFFVAQKLSLGFQILEEGSNVKSTSEEHHVQTQDRLRKSRNGEEDEYVGTNI